MNNRFKFRVWKKAENKMVEGVTYLNPLLLDEEIAPDKAKNYIVMQSTGLKDKNGKLIYEGDIVNGSCGVYWGKMIVEYNVAGFVLNKNGKYLNFLESDNFIEVIGNKFENPELLKECE